MSGPPAQDPVHWDTLPEAVRNRLASIASNALDALPEADVPLSLRRLAFFAPAKRARLGAARLLAALRDSPAFRAAVLAWWTGQAGEPTTDASGDPPSEAAAAILAEAPDAAALVAAVARHSDAASARTERDAALARVDKLTAEVDRLRAELTVIRSRIRDAERAREGELDRMRRKLSDQGGRLRQAADAAQAAEAALAEQRRSATEELAAARAERDREHARAERERLAAERAAAELTAARQAAREARQADEVRLELLLDTAAGAVAGLRRELGLSGGGPRPADLVPGASRPVQGGRVGDVAGLDRLLGLPSVHLIVDGYNASKTGYPELTLADQRDRLVGQLAALAARTRAETTVVFDGAAVGGLATRSPRGVRVLFSDPGVPADDVIRALVAAEPDGRPVVVASSDRAVADSVLHRGAYPVPSAVLLARLVRS
jgi:predicted RNA-binding protein with PIN domain